MPLNKYFKGDGPQVMTSMQKRYGSKKGKSVFYATANSRPGMGSKKGAGLSPKAASLGAKNFGQSKDKLTPGDTYDTGKVKYVSKHARKRAKRRYRAKS